MMTKSHISIMPVQKAKEPNAKLQVIPPDEFEDKFWMKLIPSYNKQEKAKKNLKVSHSCMRLRVVEIIEDGYTEDEAGRMIAEYVSSTEFLSPHLQKIMRARLEGDRLSVRLLTQVPYLYTDTRLRPFFEKTVKTIKSKKKNYLSLHRKKYYLWVNDDPKMKSYLKIVRKNTEEFLSLYNRVMDAYRNTIMQTEFKFQLVVGSDIANLILSYV